MRTLEKQWHDGSLIGREVEVLGERRTVVTLYPEIEGGVRLDHPVEGFISWNISELSVTRRSEAKEEK